MGDWIVKGKHTPEQIVAKLRQAEVELARGQPAALSSRGWKPAWRRLPEPGGARPASIAPVHKHPVARWLPEPSGRAAISLP